ncbi:MAG TPA: phenylalanine--tRNA ligase subunit beta [Candidatus Saccharimonadales bacterium]|nr:phenylalanine--tRNA ligase subunit beta [Candidatus Saccharimonadales bacterium]
MKVSYNWLQELVDSNLPPIDELVDKIGAQLGGVEEVINLGERYQGIVIAKVVECKPVEGSDHLNVCRIDDGKVVKDVERGDDGLVQVVCGAPNCREGLLVAWLPPGTTVPASYDEGELFVLGARDLRGHKSNGMLASPKELAIGDSHDGILELNADDAKPGDDFAETYEFAGEYIIEIENKMFTHRPDCFGILGVAREVAGILGKPFRSEEWYLEEPLDLTSRLNGSLPLKVTNELPELVPRFMALSMANVSTGMPSLPWMATRLSRVGIRPINLIVDITNYFMVLTGQPMHAYDYDKVKALSSGDAAHLVVRAPHDKEKLTVLGEKQITLRSGDIVIASDKAAVGLGGVMGGANSNIDDQTKNIILECATFDMYAIRRTSMAHGLFTDAVTRFNKGQSPLQNDRVLAVAARSLWHYTDKQVESGSLVDDIHLSKTVQERRSLHPKIAVTPQFINERLGSDLGGIQIRKLLMNVEFELPDVGDDGKDASLEITAPFWRTDIELREDVVEEVGRLYGYDNLPLKLPTRDIAPAARNQLLAAKDAIRQKLSKAGANEVLTYSFVHGDLLTKVGQDPSKAFQLSNALSPDLQYYRLSLMPSLLDKVHANIKAVHANVKATYDEFALFEIGKVHSLDHQDDDGLPAEHEHTSLVVTAADKLKKPGAAYYQARYLLDYLTGSTELEFKPIAKDLQGFPVVQPYDLDRSAVVYVKGGDFLGIIGEFKASVLRNLKLPKFTAGFDLDTTVLAKLLTNQESYQPLSRFPSVSHDITFKVAGNLPFAELFDFVSDEVAKKVPQNSHFDLQPVDRYQAEGDTQLNISLRLAMTSYERTLTDKELSELIHDVATAARAKLGAERV